MATWILEMTFKPPTPTYCLLVITYDALIIPSEPRIFHRRYLSCLYWRLPWSIPTYTVSRLPGMCKLYLLFLKNSWVTLSSWLNSFFVLPALFFATAILNPSNFYFLSWAEWECSFCVSYTSIRNLFQRKWWWSEWSLFFYFFLGVTSNLFCQLLQLIFFYSCCLFFLNSSSLFRCKYFLFLSLIFFLLYLWSCTYLRLFLNMSYSNPCLFSPFRFWFDDDRRLNSWKT